MRCRMTPTAFSSRSDRRTIGYAYWIGRPVSAGPRADAANAAVTLQRAHRARVKLVVDQVPAATMQVYALAQTVGRDENIGTERAVEERDTMSGLPV